MMKKHKTLCVISLGLMLTSCASRPAGNTVSPKKKKNVKTAQVIKTEPQELPKKPEIKHKGDYDFYTVNIADASKNNSTVSYGSIVSASPENYTISKTYFPSVGQNFRQRFLVIHYTALNDEKSISVLTQQSVSAHYLVNDLDDKDIYQLVDENKRAYHAGISYWKGFTQLNDNAVGIEIVNPGYTMINGSKVFSPYPDYQFKKVAALIKDIADRYMIPATNILGHSDIAPTRKQDPGPLFPWKRLYTEYNLGMWYDDAVKMSFISQNTPEIFDTQAATAPFIFKYQSMLKDFGYDINPSGTADTTTQKTIEAFQYHFRPEKYDGIMDIETYSILQALLQKYPK